MEIPLVTHKWGLKVWDRCKRVASIHQSKLNISPRVHFGKVSWPRNLGNVWDILLVYAFLSPPLPPFIPLGEAQEYLLVK